MLKTDRNNFKNSKTTLDNGKVYYSSHPQYLVPQTRKKFPQTKYTPLQTSEKILKDQIPYLKITIRIQSYHPNKSNNSNKKKNIKTLRLVIKMLLLGPIQKISTISSKIFLDFERRLEILIHTCIVAREINICIRRFGWSPIFYLFLYERNYHLSLHEKFLGRPKYSFQWLRLWCLWKYISSLFLALLSFVMVELLLFRFIFFKNLWWTRNFKEWG